MTMEMELLVLRQAPTCGGNKLVNEISIKKKKKKKMDKFVKNTLCEIRAQCLMHLSSPTYYHRSSKDWVIA